MNTVEALEGALVLIRQGWCQGRANKPTSTGWQHCSLYAVEKAGGIGRLFDEATNALYRALPSPGTQSAGHEIVKYNDAPGRTHGEIIALFERAIEMEKAKAA